jgi:predicted MPP superfamily phosphohydrolase
MSTLSNIGKGAGAAFLAGFAYSLWEPYYLVVREFEVRMTHLPSEAEGLRIAQLSDLHGSAITSFSFLRRAVQKCNELAPDVVALTGDFVSRRNSYSKFSGARMWAKPVMEYARDVAGVLAALRAPGGVFAVPGNHDHCHRRCDAIMDELQKAGIVPLVNTSTLVRGVPIVGFDDLRGGRPALRHALHGIPAMGAHLVLSHNPRLLSQVAGRNCLMLAGHTHAGQVHLPVLPFRLKPSDVVNTPHLNGWYRNGAARLYVNNGLGSVHFPMRFRCPPEISVFTLRSADE